MPERTEATVTFVVHRGECLAFIRATRAVGDTAWRAAKPKTRNGILWMPGYAHDGQHGEFDHGILRKARRASEREYAPLMAELESLGYVVVPQQRGRQTPPRYRTPTDGELAGMDRGAIWSLMWRMRGAGAHRHALHYVCTRWETLTGERYHGEEGPR